jgi:hypothetical protein
MILRRVERDRCKAMSRQGIHTWLGVSRFSLVWCLCVGYLFTRGRRYILDGHICLRGQGRYIHNFVSDSFAIHGRILMYMIDLFIFKIPPPHSLNSGLFSASKSPCGTGLRRWFPIEFTVHRIRYFINVRFKNETRA